MVKIINTVYEEIHNQKIFLDQQNVKQRKSLRVIWLEQQQK